MISINLWSNFIEITLLHWCFPVSLLHIFRTPFLPKNTSERLLLYSFERAVRYKMHLATLRKLQRNRRIITESSEQFLKVQGRELAMESFISKVAACKFFETELDHRNSPMTFANICYSLEHLWMVAYILLKIWNSSYCFIYSRGYRQLVTSYCSDESFFSI